MAGVFPGASTLDQFWHNIVEKKDACGGYSGNRWVARPADMVSPLPTPDKAFHRRGCVIRILILIPMALPFLRTVCVLLIRWFTWSSMPAGRPFQHFSPLLLIKIASAVIPGGNCASNRGILSLRRRLRESFKTLSSGKIRTLYPP